MANFGLLTVQVRSYGARLFVGSDLDDQMASCVVAYVGGPGPALRVICTIALGPTLQTNNLTRII